MRLKKSVCSSGKWFELLPLAGRKSDLLAFSNIKRISVIAFSENMVSFVHRILVWAVQIFVD
jgi:hypothetical protein